MGRAPCCDKANVKKGPWSPEEDAKLKEFVEKFGTGGNWIALPQKAGLKRCGKSCRLRWLNYLRPNIKHGEFSEEEDRIICRLYASIGSRWSIIAAQLPGRTDNDIKNYWNTKLKKKLMGMIPIEQRTFPHPFPGTLQTEPQPQSGQSQLYTDHNTFYFPSAVSLAPVDSLSPPQNFAHYNSENFSLCTSQCSYYHQSQDGLVDLQYYPAGDHSNNMLIFGGNEASCSSSDGSCSQISHGKEFHQVKQEQMKCLQDFVSDAFDESLMLMLPFGKIHGDHYGDPFLGRRPNGGLENSQVQCDLEEVTQLISTGNCSNNSVRFT